MGDTPLPPGARRLYWRLALAASWYCYISMAMPYWLCYHGHALLSSPPPPVTRYFSLFTYLLFSQFDVPLFFIDGLLYHVSPDIII